MSSGVMIRGGKRKRGGEEERASGRKTSSTVAVVVVGGPVGRLEGSETTQEGVGSRFLYEKTPEGPEEALLRVAGRFQQRVVHGHPRDPNGGLAPDMRRDDIPGEEGGRKSRIYTRYRIVGWGGGDRSLPSSTVVSSTCVFSRYINIYSLVSLDSGLVGYITTILSQRGNHTYRQVGHRAGMGAERGERASENPPESNGPENARRRQVRQALCPHGRTWGTRAPKDPFSEYFS